MYKGKMTARQTDAKRPKMLVADLNLILSKKQLLKILVRVKLGHLLSYRSKTKLNVDLTDPLMVLLGFTLHIYF